MAACGIDAGAKLMVTLTECATAACCVQRSARECSLAPQRDPKFCMTASDRAIALAKQRTTPIRRRMTRAGSAKSSVRAAVTTLGLAFACALCPNAHLCAEMQRQTPWR